MKYLDIIKAPVVTEKSALLNEKNEYAFFVDVKANKTEIKDAIEKLFNVCKLILSIITSYLSFWFTISNIYFFNLFSYHKC